MTREKIIIIGGLLACGVSQAMAQDVEALHDTIGMYAQVCSSMTGNEAKQSCLDSSQKMIATKLKAIKLQQPKAPTDFHIVSGSELPVFVKQGYSPIGSISCDPICYILVGK